jgi:thymidylate synthase (FAD)
MSDDQVEVIPHSMSYLDCSLKYGMTHIEYLQHQWMSVRFVCDRGVSHEIVRHRDASFAQESTRYCNYSQDKFGNEVTFIEPCFWNIHITGDTDRSYCSVDWEDAMRTSEQLYCSVDWEDAMRTAEQLYFTILKQGSTPQEARSVLPNSLKTELVMTATMQEWCHFFNLRALGKTGKPHPQMLELALPLYHECVDKEIIKG